MDHIIFLFFFYMGKKIIIIILSIFLISNLTPIESCFSPFSPSLQPHFPFLKSPSSMALRSCSSTSLGFLRARSSSVTTTRKVKLPFISLFGICLFLCSVHISLWIWVHCVSLSFSALSTWGKKPHLGHPSIPLNPHHVQ